MPLKLQTVQASVFRSLVEALNGILCDTNLKFGPHGLTICDLDFARVACVRVSMPAASFESYECDREYVVGAYIQHLNAIMKMASSTDTLSIEIEDENDTEMVIRMHNTEKNTRNVYRMYRMDIDEDNLSIPASTFSSVTYMPSADLQRIFRDLSGLADTVYIRNLPDKLVFHVKGEYCSAEREFVKTEVDNTANSSASFVLKYLKLFCKASSVSTFCELYMQDRFPLVLKFGMSLGTLEYFLAPKAEEQPVGEAAMDT